MDEMLTLHHSRQWTARTGRRLYGTTLLEPLDYMRFAVHSHGDKSLAVVSVKMSKIRLAYSRRFFQHCVEHWGKVAGRRIDDLQHLGGRGLLLQRLARLGQQPRILH